MTKLLKVSVSQQKVFLYDGEKLIWEAPVSTSSKGTGNENGSNKTPLGKHSIALKIGEDSPLGAVFKFRKPTGEIWSAPNQVEDDLILTRILPLKGEEEATANTFARYVYFHGTNHEDKIGQPASHGCIRLKNADVIKLFDLVEVGTPVSIEA
jgi:hypothetical protein